jgi:hypothetical protein
LGSQDLLFLQYDDAIKDCNTAVEKGRELRADYKSIAKALTRKGTAYCKMAKTAKVSDALSFDFRGLAALMDCLVLAHTEAAESLRFLF